MQIHQGEHDGVENGEYVGHRRKANTAPILPQDSIAPPMPTLEVQESLGRALLLGKARPPIEDFNAGLALTGALALHPKDLSDFTPVPRQVIVAIGTGEDVATFETTMAFLYLLRGLPGLPIGLRICKKQFEIGAGSGWIHFDDEDQIPSCSVDHMPKLMIALGCVGGDNAPFAQHFGEPGFERTQLVVPCGNRTLLQDNASLDFIHVQHVLLGFLSPIRLLVRPLQRLAIHRQMNLLLVPLGG